MAGGLYPVAGSKIFIGAEVDAKGTVVAADFDAAVWVEIGGWANAGELGDNQEVGEQSLINESRMRKFKSVLNAGNMENQFVPMPTDPGQIAFKAAILSCKPYQFKIEWGAGCGETEAPEGMTDMFYGLALPGSRTGGDASAVQLRNWTIAVDSNIVEV